MKNFIQLCVSGIATAVSFLFGGWDMPIQGLLLFIVIDFITGLIKAWHNNELNSKVCKDGIIKKIGYLFLVVVSVFLDRVAGETGVIRNLVIYFFIANEGLSILENWGQMGVWYPKILKEKLEQLRGEEDKNK